MANLVDVGQRGECRTDSAAARSPSRALGVCPLPLPAVGRVESRAGAWAGAGGGQEGGGTVTVPALCWVLCSSLAAGRVHPVFICAWRGVKSLQRV